MSRKKANDEVRETLDDIALDIANQIRGPSISLTQKLDGFKAVSAYYLGIKKAKVDKDEEDEDRSGSFGAIKRKAKGGA